MPSRTALQGNPAFKKGLPRVAAVLFCGTGCVLGLAVLFAAVAVGARIPVEVRVEWHGVVVADYHLVLVDGCDMAVAKGEVAHVTVAEVAAPVLQVTMHRRWECNDPRQVVRTQLVAGRAVQDVDEDGGVFDCGDPPPGGGQVFSDLSPVSPGGSVEELLAVACAHVCLVGDISRHTLAGWCGRA